MPISFTINSDVAYYLSRLEHGCDNDDFDYCLAHIGLSVSGNVARFTATNGCILGCVAASINSKPGKCCDVVLNRRQFTDAMKMALMSVDGKIRFNIFDASVSVNIGRNTMYVDLVDGMLPNPVQLWDKVSGKQWIPSMVKYDPQLMAIAQKMSGSKSVLQFLSPVDPSSQLRRVWANSGALNFDAISVNDLRAAINAPMYWSSEGLAILMMPIRSDVGESRLDLSLHATPGRAAATARGRARTKAAKAQL